MPDRPELANEFDEPCSMEDFAERINYLNTKKATRPGGVSNRVLKEGLASLSFWIGQLEQCLTEGFLRTARSRALS